MTTPKRKKKHVHRYNWCSIGKMLIKKCGGKHFWKECKCGERKDKPSKKLL